MRLSSDFIAHCSFPLCFPNLFSGKMEKDNTQNNNNNKNSPEFKERFAFVICISLRFIAACASFISAHLMFSNKQTAVIYGIQMVAKYSYSSAFRFMACANLVTGALALVSGFAFLSLAKESKKMSSNSYFIFFLHDLVVTLLELAACAAGTAEGYVGSHGNERAGWMPICDHVRRFCDKGRVSVAFSYMTFVVFLCLTIISASSSRKLPRSLDSASA